MAIITGVWFAVESGGVGALEGRWFEIVAALLAWLGAVASLVVRLVYGGHGRQVAWATLAVFGAILGVFVWYGVRG